MSERIIISMIMLIYANDPNLIIQCTGSYVDDYFTCK